MDSNALMVIIISVVGMAIVIISMSYQRRK